MSGGGSDRRNKRLASTLQRAVEEVLARGLNDPRARGMISVTELRLSGDLRQAKVMVSVFPHEHESLTIHALRDAAKHIRRRLMDKVEIRDMPQLVFELDEGLKRQGEVLELLAKARAERAEAGGEAAESDEGGNEGSENSA